MRLRYALLVATAILFAGTTTALLPSAEAVGTSSLSGQVCTEPDGYARPMPASEADKCPFPVPGATVHLTRPSPVPGVAAVDQTRTTGDDGRFSFERLADGEYTLEVSRRAFAAATVTVTVAGETTRNVALSGEAIQQPGKVVGPRGEPVAGAQVMVDTPRPEDGAMARTAPDGSFEVSTVAGHRGIHVFDAGGYQELHEVRFLDGTSVVLRLAKTPPPDAYVAGVVRDQDGKPVSGAHVRATSYSRGCCPEPMPPGGGDVAYSPMVWGGTNSTVTGADGRYRLGVYSGTVELAAEKEGHTPRSLQLEAKAGETANQDLTLRKYPDKTARISGQATDADGNPVPAISLSVRSPLYGIHECSTNGKEPSPPRAEPLPAQDASSPATSVVYPEPYPHSPCSITVDEEGRFEGLVTPGYSIVEVHDQGHFACTAEEGRACGPAHHAWARTLELPANATTRIDVRLERRPGPDATVSGYVLDDGTGKPIPGATVAFYNQDNGAYGHARTDGDGSFAVRVRSGYHSVSVSVWREDGRPGGYLTWQGILPAKPGENPFDVRLTPGEEAGGGCCWAYRSDLAYAEGVSTAGGGGAMPPGGPGGPTTGGLSASQDEDTSASARDFEDLGGGLGPYDPDARRRLLESAGESRESPVHAVALTLAVLGAAVVARRRR